MRAWKTTSSVRATFGQQNSSGYNDGVMVTKGELSSWLATVNPPFRDYLLTRSDPARVVSLREFDLSVKKLATNPREIAIVSGSETEPELQLLTPGFNLTLFNYEENQDLFDLTLDWSDKRWKDYHGRFDLVLCEQVLEHLPEPQRAFDNLKMLAKEGGVIHVSTPALNNSHGEPHYYYSGFHPRALEHFAHKSDLHNVVAEAWSSNKASRMYSTCDWAPLSESGPLRFLVMSLPFIIRRPRKLARTLLNRLRNMALYPFQPLFSGADSSNFVISWMYSTKA